MIPTVRAKPLITVCIATYNQQELIQSAVMSALSQRSEEFDLEILIGDDASTDGTPKILSRLELEYPKWVRVVNHAINMGAALNYKFLISVARGQFIAHLDGDDYWLPEKLARQIVFLANNTDCIAVYSNAIVVDVNGDLRGIFTNDQPSKISITYLLERGNFINHSSLLYRSEAVCALTALKYPLIDYRIHIELAKSGKLGFINDTLVAYRTSAPLSMLKNSPGHVRTMYYEALSSAIEHLNSKTRCDTVANYALNRYRDKLRTHDDNDFWADFWKLVDLAQMSSIEFIVSIVRRFLQLATYALKSTIISGISEPKHLMVFHPRI
ncbi:MAG: glycosyltransferase [Betaproteobacteria bacterium]